MEPVRKRSGLQLTTRDHEILRYLGTHGFASAKWLQDAFWNGQTNKHHFRRLARLRDGGLIEDLLAENGTRLGYRLSKKGYRWISRENDKQGIRPPIRTAYRTNFRHDDLLLGIGNVIRPLLGVANFRNEATIREELAKRHGHPERKNEGYKVPDAIFELKTKDRIFRVAIELELTLKNRARCERNCRKWVTSFDYDLVFVLFPDAKIMHCLKRTLAHVRAKDPCVLFSRRDNGVYFALLDEFLEKRGNANFTGEGRAFTIATLTENNTQKPGT